MMSEVIKQKVVPLTLLMMAALTLIGILRLSGYQESFLSPFSGLATPLYIAATVLFAVTFRRMGVKFSSFGFSPRINRTHVGLAIAAVIMLQLSSVTIGPLIENIFGGGRHLGRFAHLEGSIPALLVTLALSWSFAAFGEELAYRIVLMRAMAVSMGEGRLAWMVAVVLQALVFGLVHMYQGPAGVAGATISGLVFGTVTLLARGSIWPAALAHGANNTIGLVSIYLGSN